MSSRIARVKEEIREILLVAVFFSTGFCLVHVCNQLLTAGSNVQLSSITRSLFGGFIVAKVLLTVDLLPFLNAFPSKPLVHNIVWKSTLYVSAGIIFLYVEPFLKNVIKGAGVYSSHFRAWQELMLPRTWATVIFLAMLMVVFVTIKEMTRVLGEDRMRQMFFGQRRKPSTERATEKNAA